MSPKYSLILRPDEIFQKSGDQDSFRHRLKNSANICNSSGSQFFRTNTGTQRKPETSE